MIFLAMINNGGAVDGVKKHAIDIVKNVQEKIDEKVVGVNNSIRF